MSSSENFSIKRRGRVEDKTDKEMLWEQSCHLKCSFKLLPLPWLEDCCSSSRKGISGLKSHSIIINVNITLILGEKNITTYQLHLHFLITPSLKLWILILKIALEVPCVRSHPTAIQAKRAQEFRQAKRLVVNHLSQRTYIIVCCFDNRTFSLTVQNWHWALPVAQSYVTRLQLRFVRSLNRHLSCQFLFHASKHFLSG